MISQQRKAWFFHPDEVFDMFLGTLQRERQCQWTHGGRVRQERRKQADGSDTQEGEEPRSSQEAAAGSWAAFSPSRRTRDRGRRYGDHQSIDTGRRAGRIYCNEHTHTHTQLRQVCTLLHVRFVRRLPYVSNADSA